MELYPEKEGSENGDHPIPNVISIESQKGTVTHKLLTEALKEAENAVRLDNSKDLSNALFAYQSTVIHFIEVLQKMGEECADSDKSVRNLRMRERDKIIELRDIYIARINVLLNNLPYSYFHAYNTRIYRTQISLHPNWSFKPAVLKTTVPRQKQHTPGRQSEDNNLFEGSPDVQFDVPNDNTLQSLIGLPYEEFHVRYTCKLMSILAVSMLAGANLTPNLFVPKELWSQNHYKIPFIKQKLDLFHVITSSLEAIHNINISDSSAINSELDNFISTLDNVQCIFFRRMTSIDYHQQFRKKIVSFSKLSDPNYKTFSYSTPSVNTISSRSKLFDSVGNAFNKSLGFISDQISSKSSGFHVYSKNLLKLLCSSQILDKLLSYYKSDRLPAFAASYSAATIEKLSTASNLLSSVLYSVIINDFHLIADSFIKRATESIF